MQTESTSVSPKILLVYFSHTGRTCEVAHFISQAIDCDIEQIRPVKQYTDDLFLLKDQIRTCSHDVLPPIHKPEHDITQYGTVILGTPVWNNSVPPPVMSYIRTVDWRGIRIHPFMSCGGIYMFAYNKLINVCKGASFGAPLFLIYDINGRFIGASW
ncbi:MAG: hypothetical protein K6F79_00805 [Saccharofermentans sp.]|nr:hypothetical protein [Saccharofermentans sp.]